MIRAAWPYVISMGGAALFFFLLQLPLPGVAALAAGAAVGLFFRDPERRIPPGEHLVVSPADGRVVEVSTAPGGDGGKIAIFLSLFNVHVNRSPVSGTIRAVTYRAGTFRPAFAADAGSRNERNTLDVEGPGGLFGVSQIAGLVARRIRCFKKSGEAVARGERIGYIAFGSRTELTLPPGAEIVVKMGERVRGAETVVARLLLPAGKRDG